jgi:hypothetical protein
MVFLVGVYPGPLMELLDVSIINLLEQTRGVIPVDVAALDGSM